MKMLVLAFLVSGMLPTVVFSQGLTVPIDVTIDTGSHTCARVGQEVKVYKTISAGEGRYFFNQMLAEVSRFGAGTCEYNSDGAGLAYETKEFCLTDADNQKECTQRPVKVIVRAFADCTNNAFRLTSRIGTECRFVATSKRGELK